MSTGTGDHATYEFGPFRLDPVERLLVRDGHAVALTPKAFDLLTYLVARHGHLAEKQALLSAIWPDAIVEEANLAYTVSALRKVLEDGTDGDSMIQTVPTRGYRFVGAVKAQPRVEEGSDAAQPTRDRRSASGARSSLKWLLLATGLVISAAGLWVYVHQDRQTDAAGPLTAVPFTTFAGWESAPSFSPDGSQLAFAWSGDLFVKVIGSEKPLRLTQGRRRRPKDIV